MKASPTLLDELIIADESGFACSKTKLVEDGLIHLRPFNLTNDGALSFDELYRVPVDEAPKGKRKLEVGDILFNNTNSVELVGKAVLIEHPIEAGFSNHLTRIRVNQARIVPHFMAYWLLWTRYTGHFSSQATQWVSQAAFKSSELRRMMISLPTVAEQRRIVDILSRAEGIVRLRREAQKKIAEIIPAMFLDMFGDPATNTKGWERLRLDEISEISYGIADKLDTSITAEDGLRILTISNVLLDGSIDPTVLRFCKATDDKVRKCSVQRGDLLFNWRNGSETHIGKTAIWESDTNVLHVSFLLRLRPNIEQLNSYFIWVMLNLMRARGFFLGASRQQINRKFNASELSALALPIPPKELQDCFARRIESVRSIQSQQFAATAKAESTFNALLGQTFQG